MTKEMWACKNASKYKGVRSPTCGCTACKVIWLEAELNRTIDYSEKLLALIDDAAIVLSRPLQYNKY
jgi:hypothetical protein